MSKNNNMSLFEERLNEDKCSLESLCSCNNWLGVIKYLDQNANFTFKELTNVLKEIITSKLTNRYMDEKILCFVNVSKKLKNHQLPADFPKIVINQKNLFKYFVKSIECVQSIIDIKNLFVDDMLYILLRHAKLFDTFKLLLHNVDVRYINDNKYKIHSTKYAQPFLHYVGLAYSKCFFKEVVNLPGVDLYLRNADGKTMTDLFEERISCIVESLQDGVRQHDTEASVLQEDFDFTIKKGTSWSNHMKKKSEFFAQIISSKGSNVKVTDVKNSVQNIVSVDDENFTMTDINQWDSARMMEVLEGNSGFVDEKQLKVDSMFYMKTPAQYIVSLMRYDLMDAIVQHIHQIPSSVSIANIVVHQWSSQFSSEHLLYKHNLLKFLQLFIAYDKDSLTIAFSLATKVQNMLVLNVISSYMNDGCDIEKYPLSVVITALCRAEKWVDVVEYIKQQTTLPNFNDLVRSLGVVFQCKWVWNQDKSGYYTKAVIALSDKIARHPLPHSCTVIDVAKTKVLFLLSDLTCINNIINIKYLFKESVMDYLLEKSVHNAEAFNILIHHVQPERINKIMCYANKLPKQPLLHAICLYGTPEMLQNFVNLNGINLHIYHDGKTALDNLKYYANINCQFSYMKQNNFTLLDSYTKKEKILTEALNFQRLQSVIETSELGKRNECGVEDDKGGKKQKVSDYQIPKTQSILMYEPNDNILKGDDSDVELKLLLGNVEEDVL